MYRCDCWERGAVDKWEENLLGSNNVAVLGNMPRSCGQFHFFSDHEKGENQWSENSTSAGGWREEALKRAKEEEDARRIQGLDFGEERGACSGHARGPKRRRPEEHPCRQKEEGSGQVGQAAGRNEEQPGTNQDGER